MTLFGTLLAGGAAILTIAAGIAFVCDELSSEEQRRQDQMRREHKEYERRKQQEYRDAHEYFRQERQHDENAYQEQLRTYQVELLQKRKDANRLAFQQMLQIWELQYADKEKLLEQCREIVRQVSTIIQGKQHSYTRFNSMKSTLISLQEAVYKLEAYLRYMDGIKIDMEILFESEGALAEPFSMVLPEDYPYDGKVIELKKSDFSGYRYECSYIGPIFLDRSENELFDQNCSTLSLPFMVHTARNGRQYLSLSRGLLKNSIGGIIGLDMEVVKVNSKYIILRFANNPYISVRIAKRDLINPNRRTPIGSSLHVFVTDYEFALNGWISVSEKAADGMSIAHFDTVPLLQSSTEHSQLRKYLEDNRLLEETDEWRIGPRMDADRNLTGLVFQKGTHYAIETSFEDIGNSQLVLRYNGLLPAEDFISFDDPFVAANVTLNCYPHQKVLNDPGSYTTFFEECSKLRLYLTREYSIQRKILARSPMSIYLDQWLEVTNRLIEHQAYGSHLILKVDEWKPSQVKGGLCTLLHVENESEFRRFLEHEAGKHRDFFFIEITDENGISRLPCRAFSAESYGMWVRVSGLISESVILEQEFSFDLYSLCRSYTEQQQVNAFRMFKEGRVASVEIMTAILNTGAYQYTDAGHHITALFNSNIQNNASQLTAITRAFSEKHFFLIQGPPGTGKTTVIKELILQQLQTNPAARILVVSQANVAVDNVLRGIASSYAHPVQIVRCGNTERISQDIEKYAFKEKYETYMNQLRSEELPDPKTQALRKKWIRIIDESEHTDFVGECLLNCFQIIGATCLGLENRHFGLSGMEFDLVVIDEAGKALAGELLIPINRAKKVVIIGDHMQLPPVIAPELYQGGEVQYDDIVDQKQQNEFTMRSFFQRLYEDCPEESKCMLNTQFRMPPVIANLISTFFYNGQLENGENCIHKKPMFLQHHLIFVDMKDEPNYHEKQDIYESGKKSGPYNDKELEAAAAVVRRIRDHYAERIVVITPYKKQKAMLISHFKQEDLMNNVWINTIDAFQGDEADIVLYCTTRSRRITDYFSDHARLNVAFSRARNTLIFLGSSSYLKMYPKDHVLQKIHAYLADHAAVVPYAQWDQIDLLYDVGFRDEAKCQNSSMPLPIPNDFFQEQHTQSVSEQSCMACGKVLTGEEYGLCPACITKIEDRHHCQHCGKTILLSYYDIYLNNVPVPELCADCQDTHYEATECTECGKHFYIQHEQKEELLYAQEDILCPACESYANTLIYAGNCNHCFHKVHITRRERKRRNAQNRYLPLFCPECEEQSRQTIVAGTCKQCHQSIIINYQQRWNLEAQNKPMPVYCNICRKRLKERITVGICEVCNHDITINGLQYDAQPYWNYRYCKDCRNAVAKFEICTQCGNLFEIKYGEKQYFEEKGFYLPKKCKNCRKSVQYDF